MPFVEQLGMQATQGVLGAGMGMLLGAHERKQQIKQQQKLQNMQIAGQMEMGRFNQQQALEMWEKTNFAAQKEQMKKAGLSPGLLYGMSGAGGAIANPTPGNVTGGQAAAAGPAAGMGIAMGSMQLQLLDAQKKNIEADTKLKETTVPKTEAETGSILQNTENAKIQGEILKIEESMKAIEEEIKGRTQNAAIATIMSQLRTTTAIMHTAETQQKITQATADKNIEMVAAELAAIYVNNRLTEEKIQLTEEERKQVIEQTKATAQSIINEQARVKIDQQIANFETSFGKQVGGIVGSLLGLIPGMGTRKTATTVTHKGGAQNTTIHKRQ